MKHYIPHFALFAAIAASIGFMASCDRAHNKQDNDLIESMAKQGYVQRQHGWGRPEWVKESQP